MNKFRLHTILLSVGLLGLAASTAIAQPARKKGYEAQAVNNGGTIVGVVHYDGPTPTPERVDVKTKEDVCHADPIFSEKLVVSENKEVQWAVISIKGIRQGKQFERPAEDKDKPTIDQNGCKFDPHIAIVAQGQPLKVLNSDGVLHNVHTWSKKNRSKNIAMPGVIKETKLKFRRSEYIRVTCDIHPWMEAYVIVMEHPYYEITDEKGAFKLNDVPPGTYTLTLWHETLGKVEQRVTVNSGEESHVEFMLSAK